MFSSLLTIKPIYISFLYIFSVLSLSLIINLIPRFLISILRLIVRLIRFIIWLIILIIILIIIRLIIRFLYWFLVFFSIVFLIVIFFIWIMIMFFRRRTFLISIFLRKPILFLTSINTPGKLPRIIILQSILIWLIKKITTFLRSEVKCYYLKISLRSLRSSLLSQFRFFSADQRPFQYILPTRVGYFSPEPRL